MSESSASPDGSPARRDLVLLGLGTSGLLMTLVASYPFLRLLWRWWGVVPSDLPFAGWQVEVTRWGLVALLGAMGSVSLVTAARSGRRLAGRPPNLMLPVLVALGPGLLLGLLAARGVHPALTWASNHTAEGREAAARTAQLLREQRVSPTISTRAPAAPAELAARLLRSSDLGAGWYPQTRPSAHLTQPLAGLAGLDPPSGLVLSARTTLQRAHRQGEGWAAEAFLDERIRRFSTAAQAQAYLTRQWPKDLCHCEGTAETWSVRTFGQVRLWRLTTPATALPPGGVTMNRETVAAFRVGVDVLELRFTPYETAMAEGGVTTTSASTRDTSAELLRYVKLALRRATGA